MIQYVLPTILPALQDLVHKLVTGDYVEIENTGLITESSSLTAAKIGTVISDYGETLIDMPDEAFLMAEAYGSRGISFPLWTQEEQLSGLTLNVEVTGLGSPVVQIQRIHGFPPKIIPAVQDLIHQLVIGNYKGLEQDRRLGGLTATDMEEIISGFQAGVVGTEPCVLIDMPANAFRRAYVNGGRGVWDVEVDVWWSNHYLEGITLKAQVQAVASGMIAIFTDLDVL